MQLGVISTLPSASSCGRTRAGVKPGLSLHTVALPVKVQHSCATPAFVVSQKPSVEPSGPEQSACGSGRHWGLAPKVGDAGRLAPSTSAVTFTVWFSACSSC